MIYESRPGVTAEAAALCLRSGNAVLLRGGSEALQTSSVLLEACQRAVEDPAIASDPTALQERFTALEAARTDVDRLYARWAELEGKL